ncbi:MAG: O-antigen ligase family protein [Candidatus Krumholzibacteria bacterium]|nr:O-antigen ligase family protein [Candidatus Krumholzibacteria bacterium]
MNSQWPLSQPRQRDALQFGLVLCLLFTASLSIAASQISLGLGLAVLLYRRLVHGDRLTRTGLGWITLALAGWALVNIPFSTDPGQSLVFFRRFFLFTAIWVVAGAAISDSRRRWLLAAMLLGAASVSIGGLVRIYREAGALFTIRLGDMSNPMTSGCLLMLVLLAACGFLVVKDEKRRFRALVAVAVLPIAAALLLTMTRSAWLGTLAGLGAMLTLARPRLAGVLAVALVALAIVLPRLPAGTLSGRLPERLDLLNLRDQHNTSARLEMWQGGWQMIKQHPLLGVGDHDLTNTAPKYFGDAGTDYYGHMHSNPIMLAVIWGIPGFCLAMAFTVWPLLLLLQRWRAWRRLGDSVSSVQQAWTLGAIGAWAGFFVAGLTEWYFGDAESMLMYLAIIGAALAEQRPAPRGVNSPAPA